MEFRIDRKCGVPIYIQLKEQIKIMINRGILEKGDKMPTERELAEKLRISRNRVSVAYKELEDEQVLTSQQGKGTFVAGKIEGIKEPSRKDKLLKIIDLALEEALELGFSFDDFLTIAYVRAKEKEELMNHIRVAFVECNREQLYALINEIDLGQKATRFSYLIQEIKEDPDRMRQALGAVDLIVTTRFHFSELKNILVGLNTELVEIALEPTMSTIVKLARIPTGAPVGLVCSTENFALEVKKNLSRIGLGSVNVKVNTSSDKEVIKDFVLEFEYIIVSPHSYNQVALLTQGEKHLIEIAYTPDHGSIKMLKMTMLDLEKKEA
ncbi:MAG: GntR family transcriptional regulator [Halanaerobiales bacterium]|nr:GntR family transcriptional regulator [Halanaerobiales bacterium]